MLLPNKPANRWHEALKLISRCPVCSFNYAESDSRTIVIKDQARLAHFNCQKCHSFFLALIMVWGQGLSTVGMVTDLNFEDVTRLYKLEPLTLDEILDGYQTVYETVGGRTIKGKK